MRTSNITLARALEILSEQIDSEDGVANAAIAEGAMRIRELDQLLTRADNALELLGCSSVSPVRANIAFATDSGETS
jgi:hypothetical protein